MNFVTRNARFSEYKNSLWDSFNKSDKFYCIIQWNLLWESLWDTHTHTHTTGATFPISILCSSRPFVCSHLVSNELLGGRPQRRVADRQRHREQHSVRVVAVGPAQRHRDRGPREQMRAARHVALVPVAVLVLHRSTVRLQARDLSPRVRQPLIVCRLASASTSNTRTHLWTVKSRFEPYFKI